MTSKSTFVIAIDGPAASGKGTLSRALATALNAAHLDTGALYRAAAYMVLQDGGEPSDEAQALEAALALTAKIKAGSEILSNPVLRTDETGQAASKLAIIPAVRAALIQLQKDFAHTPADGFDGAVLDGRDIGTVICPDADVKIFVTADTAVRAERRRKELHSKGIHVTYEAVFEDMRARDARDSGRKTAPMVPADDAVMLDTGTLNPQQALEKALQIVNETLRSTD